MTKFQKGLENIVVDTTTISHLEDGKFPIIRGHSLKDMVNHMTFYEAVNTVLDLKVSDFKILDRKHRMIATEIKDFIQSLPSHLSPYDISRMALIQWGHFNPSSQSESDLDLAIKFISHWQVLTAYSFRKSLGLSLIDPRPDLDITENFFWMNFECLPNKVILEQFNRLRITYIEHGFNAATFACRVTCSTQADFSSSMLSAFTCLSGEIHGGAIFKISEMLEEIKSSSSINAWVNEKLGKKQKIMGFGHRVYLSGDKRYHLTLEILSHLSQNLHQYGELEMVRELEHILLEQKNIKPNLDLAAAPAFELMGYQQNQLLNLIGISRAVGWCAHFLEQKKQNKLIRPLGMYVGNSSPNSETVPSQHETFQI